ncbi:MAG: beta-galactosidase [Planctomycetes bacterium]|nr:beta-galactosidase [Planctomycetota bacterium]
MPARHRNIVPGFPHLLHGGDWNPDQWLDRPEVIEQDHQLMSEAGVNALSVGIFAWAALEPEEGRYEFAWLDAILDRLAKDGRKAILATPSGSKPAWMSLKYPEVRRMHNGVREPHHTRHNHCYTAPVYRAKVAAINRALAERYARHPALGAWHLSNEYGGDCQCPLCWDAFRAWLQRRHGSLAELNRAWYTAFWGHTFSAWAEVNALDRTMHAMTLDWRRFVSDQTADFIRAEAAPLRRLTPQIPLTTNFMGTYPGLDYHRLAQELDFISWDAYPDWHPAGGDDLDTAAHTGFNHDLMRGCGGGKPWVLMESTPSSVNWKKLSRPKQPGMHRAASLQAVGHGSEGVLYFQWRKGRGCSEKFHGAVVDHDGRSDHRVFREVAALGATLGRLGAAVGAPVVAQAAVLYDWDVAWAIDEGQMQRNCDKDYIATAMDHHRPLWRRGIAVDVVSQRADLARYRLVVAPMALLLHPGVAERLESFVRAGGVLVATYLTGQVDHNDQCFLGGFPGPLRALFGVRAPEMDTPPDHVVQTLAPTAAGTALGLSGSYPTRHFDELLVAEDAEVLATYAHEWYAGTPAVTRRTVGAGEAWYIGARGDRRLADDVVGGIAARLGLERALDLPLPEGVAAQARGTGADRLVFVENFAGAPRTLALGPGWRDAESGAPLAELALARYDARVLARA